MDTYLDLLDSWRFDKEEFEKGKYISYLDIEKLLMKQRFKYIHVLGLSVLKVIGIGLIPMNLKKRLRVFYPLMDGEKV